MKINRSNPIKCSEIRIKKSKIRVFYNENQPVTSDDIQNKKSHLSETISGILKFQAGFLFEDIGR